MKRENLPIPIFSSSHIFWMMCILTLSSLMKCDELLHEKDIEIVLKSTDKSQLGHDFKISIAEVSTKNINLVSCKANVLISKTNIKQNSK